MNRCRRWGWWLVLILLGALAAWALAPGPLTAARTEVQAAARACQRLDELEALLPAAGTPAGQAQFARALDRLAGESPALASSLYLARLRLGTPGAATADLPELHREAQRQFEAASDRLGRLAAVRQGTAVGLVAGLLLLLALARASDWWYRERPLRRLAETARRVGEGDLQARAPLPADPDLAALTREFNQMLDVLVESLEDEQRALAELELANRHKSRFLATVSHELKTPLNAIIGFADILQADLHGPLTERQRDYLHRLETAGEDLRRLVADLIDTAKLDLGALALAPAPFAVAELLAELAAQMAPQAGARHQRLTVACPSGLPSLVQDRGRIKQILLNLLSNAHKFTPDGGELRLEASLAGHTWRLTVADRGIGIPEAELERIFEDFVQLDSELHRRHEGTGIGLGLARRLARLMGGDLEVVSRPGEGSRFTLCLPAAA